MFKHEEDAYSEAVVDLLLSEKGNLPENGKIVIYLLLNLSAFYNLGIR